MRVEEARSVRFGEREIAYLLKRSSESRRISLRVDERGLTVNVPWRTSDRHLRRVLDEAGQWVLKKIETYARLPRPDWFEARALKFIGNDLRVVLSAGGARNSADHEGDTLTLILRDTSDREAARTLATSWLRGQAIGLFRERAAHYAALLGTAPAKLGLSNARTRWGSCNSRGHIWLNWRLVQAPLYVIDYVIAHELAHLIELNHSPAFWRQVERIYPDFESARSSLNSIVCNGMPL